MIPQASLFEKKNNKFDTLNSEIGEKEVQSTINNLKQKKSPGYDRITNEMLQCTSPQGIKLITKLFNTILKLGIFPKDWNYGLIRLIYK